MGTFSQRARAFFFFRNDSRRMESDDAYSPSAVQIADAVKTADIRQRQTPSVFVGQHVARYKVFKPQSPPSFQASYRDGFFDARLTLDSTAAAKPCVAFTKPHAADFEALPAAQNLIEPILFQDKHPFSDAWARSVNERLLRHLGGMKGASAGSKRFEPRALRMSL